MKLCLLGTQVFILQQLSDTLGDAIRRLSQHVTSLGNRRNAAVQQWQAELGQWPWLCRLCRLCRLCGLCGLCRPQRLRGRGFPRAGCCCIVHRGFALRNCSLRWQGTQFILSHILFTCEGFFSLFFMDISVLVMIQMSHFLSFIDNDKRNKRRQQMYS